MNDSFAGVLPWLLWGGRIALSAVAVLLLIRCGRALLSGGKQESWGILSLSNGARYPLYHWENMIGRARQADIRINFPSVSRSHAALCRDSEGIWRIYPIRTGGTLLNGTVVEHPTALNPGDALSMGGVDIYFFPDQKQARRPVRTAASRGTLWLLTLFQVLMFLQFLPGLTAGASLPVCIGFGGLVLLSWVFCSLRRTGSRGLEVLALLLTTVGFAVTAAYDSHSLYKQLVAVVLAMGIYLLMDRVLQSLQLALELGWRLVAAGAALLAVGMFLSSLTDNQGFAAGIGIAAILLNYYSVSLAEYTSSTAMGSLIALYVIALLLGVVIHNLTRNENLAYGVTLVLIAALSVAYFVNSSAFEGLLPDIMTKLSLFRQFNSFVNGAFDLTAIVYYVSVMGFFLFLSVQSMEKRRYN